MNPSVNPNEIFRLFGAIDVDEKGATKQLQNVDAKAEKVSTSMSRNFDRVASMFDNVSKSIERTGKQMESFGRNLSRTAGVPLAGLTAAFAALSGATIKYGDDMAKQAQEVGMATEAYQELSFALGQNGVNADNARRALGRLNQRIGNARRGNQAYVDSLAMAGISMENLEQNALTTDEVFMQIIGNLSEMNDAQLQASVASDIFGTQVARKLLPAIRAGEQGFNELRQQAQQYGFVMDTEATMRSEQAGDAMDLLSRTIGGLTRAIGIQLLPPIINIAGAITDVVAGISEWVQENPVLVRRVIMATGAIATLLGVLVGAGTVFFITGKAIVALTTIMGLLFSKPMLIIAAIGLLYAAWVNDWGGIRTTTEEVIQVIIEQWDRMLAWWEKSKLREWILDLWGGIEDIWIDDELTLPEKVIATVSLIAGEVIGLVDSILSWWARTQLQLARRGAELLGLDPDELWIISFLEDLNDIWQDEDLTLSEKIIKSMRLIPGFAWVNDLWNDLREIWARSDEGVWGRVIETVMLFLPDDSPLVDFLRRMRAIWEQADVGTWTKTIQTVVIIFDSIKTNLEEMLSAAVVNAYNWVAERVWFLEPTDATLESTRKMLEELPDTVTGATSQPSIFEEWLDDVRDLNDELEDAEDKIGSLNQQRGLQVGSGGLGLGDSARGYSDRDLAMLAAIAQLEAGVDGVEGMAAVVEVIFNRMETNARQYGGTIEEVIRKTGQFEPAMTGAFDELMQSGRIAAESIDAVGLALDRISKGQTITGGATYFANLDIVRQRSAAAAAAGRSYAGDWMLDDRFIPTMTLGGHTFGRAGYQSGGYTGNAPVNKAVGLVHGQETVIPEPAHRKGFPGMVQWLADYMGVPGFQEGGSPGLIGGAIAGLNRFKSMLPAPVQAMIDTAWTTLTEWTDMIEESLWSLEELADFDLEALLSGKQADVEGFWASLKASLEDVEVTVEQLGSAIGQAASQLVAFRETISARDWKQAFLQIFAESASFQRILQFLNNALTPIVEMLDAVLLPVIEGVIWAFQKVGNFFIDIINTVIRIVNMIPFVNIRQISRLGEGDSVEGDTGGRTTGGARITEITGPTRDLLTDLLRPVANLGTLTGIGERIYNVLDARLPNFNDGMQLAGMGNITIENLNVTAGHGGIDAIAKATIGEVERALAEQARRRIRGTTDRQLETVGRTTR